MEASEVIRGRRSVRAFLSAEVPDEIVTEILDEARWAPSWANAQAWDVFVLKGATLGRYKSMMAEKLAAEAGPVTDIPMPQRGQWPEHIQARMTYRRPAPGAEPQPPRRPGLASIYGAPRVLLFAVDERLAVEYACFDLGLLVENVCLAAHDRGLGTCIMAMAVRYADALHEIVPQADGRRFVVAVALGHPDPESELNRTERQRCPVEDVAVFVG